MPISKWAYLQDPDQINHTCAGQEIWVYQFSNSHHYSIFTWPHFNLAFLFNSLH